MDEIELIIEEAKLRNSNFTNMSTQQQYEFIQREIDPYLMKEELEFYYDSKFGWPYDSKQFNQIYK